MRAGSRRYRCTAVTGAVSYRSRRCSSIRTRSAPSSSLSSLDVAHFFGGRLLVLLVLLMFVLVDVYLVTVFSTQESLLSQVPQTVDTSVPRRPIAECKTRSTGRAPAPAMVLAETVTVLSAYGFCFLIPLAQSSAQWLARLRDHAEGVSMRSSRLRAPASR